MARLHMEQQPGTMNKWVYLLLLLLGGLFGLHKFYESANGMGVLYIFTLGLFGLGLISDLIYIIVMIIITKGPYIPRKDFNKYHGGF